MPNYKQCVSSGRDSISCGRNNMDLPLLSTYHLTNKQMMDWLIELGKQYNCKNMISQRNLNYIPAIYELIDGEDCSDNTWQCLEDMRWRLACELAGGDWLAHFGE
jgi:hypothetical protein